METALQTENMENAEKVDEGASLSMENNVSSNAVKNCTLCGCSTPAVRCDKCGSQTFCLSCDDMYHRHPKRRYHLRRAVDSIWNSHRSPRFRRRTELPGDPSKIPVPPPRTKKRHFSSDFGMFRPNLPIPGFKGYWAQNRVADLKTQDMSDKSISPVSPVQGYENAMTNNVADSSMGKGSGSAFQSLQRRSSADSPSFNTNSASPVNLFVPGASPLPADPQNKNAVGYAQHLSGHGMHHSISAADLTDSSSPQPAMYSFAPHMHPFFPPPLSPFTPPMAPYNCPQCISASWSNLMSASMAQYHQHHHLAPQMATSPHSGTLRTRSPSPDALMKQNAAYQAGLSLANASFVQHAPTLTTETTTTAAIGRDNFRHSPPPPPPASPFENADKEDSKISGQQTLGSDEEMEEEEEEEEGQGEQESDHEVKVPEKPTEPWPCVHCTYINPPGSHICEVCCRTSYNAGKDEISEKKKKKGKKQKKKKTEEEGKVTEPEVLGTEEAGPSGSAVTEISSGVDASGAEKITDSKEPAVGGEISEVPKDSEVVAETVQEAVEPEATVEKGQQLELFTTETQTSIQTTSTDVQTHKVQCMSTASSTDGLFSTLKHEMCIQTDFEPITDKKTIATDPMISSQSLESLMSGMSAPPYHNRRAGMNMGDSYSTQSLSAFERGRSRSPMPRSASMYGEIRSSGRGLNYFPHDPMGLNWAHTWLAPDPMYYRPHASAPSPSRDEYFEGHWGSVDRLNKKARKEEEGKWKHSGKPRHYRSLEDLQPYHVPETPSVAQCLQMVKDAERRGFTVEDLQVAYHNCGRSDPLTWLQENWDTLVQSVLSLAAKCAEDNEEHDVGAITPAEAKRALHRHRGSVWDAVTECIEVRQRKILELTVRGNFTQKQIVEALKNNNGNVELAYADLIRTTSKRFKHILSPGLSEESEDISIHVPLPSTVADTETKESLKVDQRLSEKDVDGGSTEKKRSDFLAKLTAIREAQNERRKAREEKELSREVGKMSTEQDAEEPGAGIREPSFDRSPGYMSPEEMHFDKKLDYSSPDEGPRDKKLECLSPEEPPYDKNLDYTSQDETTFNKDLDYISDKLSTDVLKAGVTESVECGVMMESSQFEIVPSAETQEKIDQDLPEKDIDEGEKKDDDIPEDFDSHWIDSQGEWIEEYSDEQWDDEGEGEWVTVRTRYKKLKPEFDPDALEMAALWEKEELVDDVFEDEPPAPVVNLDAVEEAQEEEQEDEWAGAEIKAKELLLADIPSDAARVDQEPTAVDSEYDIDANDNWILKDTEKLLQSPESERYPNDENRVEVLDESEVIMKLSTLSREQEEPIPVAEGGEYEEEYKHKEDAMAESIGADWEKVDEHSALESQGKEDLYIADDQSFPTQHKERDAEEEDDTIASKIDMDHFAMKVEQAKPREVPSDSADLAQDTDAVVFTLPKLLRREKAVAEDWQEAVPEVPEKEKDEQQLHQAVVGAPPVPPTRRKSKLSDTEIRQALAEASSVGPTEESDVPPPLPRKTRDKTGKVDAATVTAAEEPATVMTPFKAADEKETQVTEGEMLEDISATVQEMPVIDRDASVPVEEMPVIDRDTSAQELMDVKGMMDIDNEMLRDLDIVEREVALLEREMLRDIQELDADKLIEQRSKDASPVTSLSCESDTNFFADSESEADVGARKTKKLHKVEAKQGLDQETFAPDVGEAEEQQPDFVSKSLFRQERIVLAEYENAQFTEVEAKRLHDAVNIKEQHNPLEKSVDSEAMDLSAGEVVTPRAFRQSAGRPLQLFRETKTPSTDKEPESQSIIKAVESVDLSPDSQQQMLHRPEAFREDVYLPEQQKPKLADNKEIFQEPLIPEAELQGTGLFASDLRTVSPEVSVSQVAQVSVFNQKSFVAELEESEKPPEGAVTASLEQEDVPALSEMEARSAVADYYFGRYNEITVVRKPKKKPRLVQPARVMPPTSMSTSMSESPKPPEQPLQDDHLSKSQVFEKTAPESKQITEIADVQSPKAEVSVAEDMGSQKAGAETQLQAAAKVKPPRPPPPMSSVLAEAKLPPASVVPEEDISRGLQRTEASSVRSEVKPEEKTTVQISPDAGQEGSAAYDYSSFAEDYFFGSYSQATTPRKVKTGPMLAPIPKLLFGKRPAPERPSSPPGGKDVDKQVPDRPSLEAADAGASEPDDENLSMEEADSGMPEYMESETEGEQSEHLSLEAKDTRPDSAAENLNQSLQQPCAQPVSGGGISAVVPKPDVLAPVPGAQKEPLVVQAEAQKSKTVRFEDSPAAPPAAPPRMKKIRTDASRSQDAQPCIAGNTNVEVRSSSSGFVADEYLFGRYDEITSHSGRKVSSSKKKLPFHTEDIGQNSGRVLFEYPPQTCVISETEERSLLSSEITISAESGFFEKDEFVDAEEEFSVSSSGLTPSGEDSAREVPYYVTELPSKDVDILSHSVEEPSVTSDEVMGTVSLLHTKLEMERGVESQEQLSSSADFQASRGDKAGPANIPGDIKASTVLDDHFETENAVVRDEEKLCATDHKELEISVGNQIKSVCMSENDEVKLDTSVGSSPLLVSHPSTTDSEWDKNGNVILRRDSTLKVHTEDVPVVDERTVQESDIKIVSEVGTEDVPAIDTETVPEVKMEVVPEAVTRAVQESNTGIISEAGTEAVSEIDTEVIPEDSMEAVPEVDERVVPEDDTGIEPELGIGFGAGVVPDVDTETMPGVDGEVIPEIDAEDEQKISMTAVPEADIADVSEDDLRIEPEHGAEFDTGVVPGVDAEAIPEVDEEVIPEISAEVEQEISMEGVPEDDITIEPEHGTEFDTGVVPSVDAEPIPEVDEVIPEISAEVEQEISMEGVPEDDITIEPEHGAEFDTGVVPVVDTEAIPGVDDEVIPEIDAEVVPEISMEGIPEVGIGVQISCYDEAKSDSETSAADLIPSSASESLDTVIEIHDGLLQISVPGTEQYDSVRKSSSESIGDILDEEFRSEMITPKVMGEISDIQQDQLVSVGETDSVEALSAATDGQQRSSVTDESPVSVNDRTLSLDVEAGLLAPSEEHRDDAEQTSITEDVLPVGKEASSVTDDLTVITAGLEMQCEAAAKKHIRDSGPEQAGESETAVPEILPEVLPVPLEPSDDVSEDLEMMEHENYSPEEKLSDDYVSSGDEGSCDILYMTAVNRFYEEWIESARPCVPELVSFTVGTSSSQPVRCKHTGGSLPSSECSSGDSFESVEENDSDWMEPIVQTQRLLYNVTEDTNQRVMFDEKKEYEMVPFPETILSGAMPSKAGSVLQDSHHNVIVMAAQTVQHSAVIQDDSKHATAAYGKAVAQLDEGVQTLEFEKKSRSTSMAFVSPLIKSVADCACQTDADYFEEQFFDSLDDNLPISYPAEDHRGDLQKMEIGIQCQIPGSPPEEHSTSRQPEQRTEPDSFAKEAAATKSVTLTDIYEECDEVLPAEGEEPSLLEDSSQEVSEVSEPSMYGEASSLRHDQELGQCEAIDSFIDTDTIVSIKAQSIKVSTGETTERFSISSVALSSHTVVTEEEEVTDPASKLSSQQKTIEDSEIPKQVEGGPMSLAKGPEIDSYSSVATSDKVSPDTEAPVSTVTTAKEADEGRDELSISVMQTHDTGLSVQGDKSLFTISSGKTDTPVSAATTEREKFPGVVAVAEKDEMPVIVASVVEEEPPVSTVCKEVSAISPDIKEHKSPVCVDIIKEGQAPATVKEIESPTTTKTVSKDDISVSVAVGKGDAVTSDVTCEEIESLVIISAVKETDLVTNAIEAKKEDATVTVDSVKAATDRAVVEQGETPITADFVTEIEPLVTMASTVKEGKTLVSKADVKQDDISRAKKGETQIAAEEAKRAVVAERHELSITVDDVKGESLTAKHASVTVVKAEVAKPTTETDKNTAVVQTDLYTTAGAAPVIETAAVEKNLETEEAKQSESVVSKTATVREMTDETVHHATEIAPSRPISKMPTVRDVKFVDTESKIEVCEVYETLDEFYESSSTPTVEYFFGPLPPSVELELHVHRESSLVSDEESVSRSQRTYSRVSESSDMWEDVPSDIDTELSLVSGQYFEAESGMPSVCSETQQSAKFTDAQSTLSAASTFELCTEDVCELFASTSDERSAASGSVDDVESIDESLEEDEMEYGHALCAVQGEERREMSYAENSKLAQKMTEEGFYAAGLVSDDGLFDVKRVVTSEFLGEEAQRISEDDLLSSDMYKTIVGELHDSGSPETYGEFSTEALRAEDKDLAQEQEIEHKVSESLPQEIELKVSYSEIQDTETKITDSEVKKTVDKHPDTEVFSDGKDFEVKPVTPLKHDPVPSELEPEALVCSSTTMHSEKMEALKEDIHKTADIPVTHITVQETSGLGDKHDEQQEVDSRVALGAEETGKDTHDLSYMTISDESERCPSHASDEYADEFASVHEELYPATQETEKEPSDIVKYLFYDDSVLAESSISAELSDKDHVPVDSNVVQVSPLSASDQSCFTHESDAFDISTISAPQAETAVATTDHSEVCREVPGESFVQSEVCEAYFEAGESLSSSEVYSEMAECASLVHVPSLKTICEDSLVNQSVKSQPFSSIDISDLACGSSAESLEKPCSVSMEPVATHIREISEQDLTEKTTTSSFVAHDELPDHVPSEESTAGIMPAPTKPDSVCLIDDDADSSVPRVAEEKMQDVPGTQSIAVAAEDEKLIHDLVYTSHDKMPERHREPEPSKSVQDVDICVGERLPLSKDALSEEFVDVSSGNVTPENLDEWKDANSDLSDKMPETLLTKTTSASSEIASPEPITSLDASVESRDTGTLGKPKEMLEVEKVQEKFKSDAENTEIRSVLDGSTDTVKENSVETSLTLEEEEAAKESQVPVLEFVPEQKALNILQLSEQHIWSHGIIFSDISVEGLSATVSEAEAESPKDDAVFKVSESTEGHDDVSFHSTTGDDKHEDDECSCYVDTDIYTDVTTETEEILPLGDSTSTEQHPEPDTVVQDEGKSTSDVMELFAPLIPVKDDAAESTEILKDSDAVADVDYKISATSTPQEDIDTQKHENDVFEDVPSDIMGAEDVDEWKDVEGEPLLSVVSVADTKSTEHVKIAENEAFYGTLSEGGDDVPKTMEVFTPVLASLEQSMYDVTQPIEFKVDVETRPCFAEECELQLVKEEVSVFHSITMATEVNQASISCIPDDTETEQRASTKFSSEEVTRSSSDKADTVADFSELSEMLDFPTDSSGMEDITTVSRPVKAVEGMSLDTVHSSQLSDAAVQFVSCGDSASQDLLEYVSGDAEASLSDALPNLGEHEKVCAESNLVPDTSELSEISDLPTDSSELENALTVSRPSVSEFSAKTESVSEAKKEPDKLPSKLGEFEKHIDKKSERVQEYETPPYLQDAKYDEALKSSAVTVDKDHTVPAKSTEAAEPVLTFTAEDLLSHKPGAVAPQSHVAPTAETAEQLPHVASPEGAEFSNFQETEVKHAEEKSLSQNDYVDQAEAFIAIPDYAVQTEDVSVQPPAPGRDTEPDSSVSYPEEKAISGHKTDSVMRSAEDMSGHSGVDYVSAECMPCEPDTTTADVSELSEISDFPASSGVHVLPTELIPQIPEEVPQLASVQDQVISRKTDSQLELCEMNQSVKGVVIAPSPETDDISDRGGVDAVPCHFITVTEGQEAKEEVMPPVSDAEYQPVIGTLSVSNEISHAQPETETASYKSITDVSEPFDSAKLSAEKFTESPSDVLAAVSATSEQNEGVFGQSSLQVVESVIKNGVAPVKKLAKEEEPERISADAGVVRTVSKMDGKTERITDAEAAPVADIASVEAEHAENIAFVQCEAEKVEPEGFAKEGMEIAFTIPVDTTRSGDLPSISDEKSKIPEHEAHVSTKLPVTTAESIDSLHLVEEMVKQSSIEDIECKDSIKTFERIVQEDAAEMTIKGSEEEVTSKGDVIIHKESVFQHTATSELPSTVFEPDEVSENDINISDYHDIPTESVSSEIDKDFESVMEDSHSIRKSETTPVDSAVPHLLHLVSEKAGEQVELTEQSLETGQSSQLDVSTAIIDTPGDSAVIVASETGSGERFNEKEHTILLSGSDEIHYSQSVMIEESEVAVFQEPSLDNVLPDDACPSNDEYVSENEMEGSLYESWSDRSFELEDAALHYEQGTEDEYTEENLIYDRDIGDDDDEEAILRAIDSNLERFDKDHGEILNDFSEGMYEYDQLEVRMDVMYEEYGDEDVEIPDLSLDDYLTGRDETEDFSGNVDSFTSFQNQSSATDSHSEDLHKSHDVNNLLSATATPDKELEDKMLLSDAGTVSPSASLPGKSQEMLEDNVCGSGRPEFSADESPATPELKEKFVAIPTAGGDENIKTSLILHTDSTECMRPETESLSKIALQIADDSKTLPTPESRNLEPDDRATKDGIYFATLVTTNDEAELSSLLETHTPDQEAEECTEAAVLSAETPTPAGPALGAETTLHDQRSLSSFDDDVTEIKIDSKTQSSMVTDEILSAAPCVKDAIASIPVSDDASSTTAAEDAVISKPSDEVTAAVRPQESSDASSTKAVKAEDTLLSKSSDEVTTAIRPQESIDASRTKAVKAEDIMLSKASDEVTAAIRPQESSDASSTKAIKAEDTMLSKASDEVTAAIRPQESIDASSTNVVKAEDIMLSKPSDEVTAAIRPQESSDASSTKAVKAEDTMLSKASDEVTVAIRPQESSDASSTKAVKAEDIMLSKASDQVTAAIRPQESSDASSTKAVKAEDIMLSKASDQVTAAIRPQESSDASSTKAVKAEDTMLSKPSDEVATAIRPQESIDASSTKAVKAEDIMLSKPSDEVATAIRPQESIDASRAKAVEDNVLSKPSDEVTAAIRPQESSDASSTKAVKAEDIMLSKASDEVTVAIRPQESIDASSTKAVKAEDIVLSKPSDEVTAAIRPQESIDASSTKAVKAEDTMLSKASDEVTVAIRPQESIDASSTKAVKAEDIMLSKPSDEVATAIRPQESIDASRAKAVEDNVLSKPSDEVTAAIRPQESSDASSTKAVKAEDIMLSKASDEVTVAIRPQESIDASSTKAVKAEDIVLSKPSDEVTAVVRPQESSDASSTKTVEDIVLSKPSDEVTAAIRPQESRDASSTKAVKAEDIVLSKASDEVTAAVRPQESSDASSTKKAEDTMLSKPAGIVTAIFGSQESFSSTEVSSELTLTSPKVAAASKESVSDAEPSLITSSYSAASDRTISSKADETSTTVTSTDELAVSLERKHSMSPKAVAQETAALVMPDNDISQATAAKEDTEVSSPGKAASEAVSRSASYTVTGTADISKEMETALSPQVTCADITGDETTGFASSVVSSTDETVKLPIPSSLPVSDKENKLIVPADAKPSPSTVTAQDSTKPPEIGDTHAPELPPKKPKIDSQGFQETLEASEEKPAIPRKRSLVRRSSSILEIVQTSEHEAETVKPKEGSDIPVHRRHSSAETVKTQFQEGRRTSSGALFPPSDSEIVPPQRTRRRTDSQGSDKSVEDVNTVQVRRDSIERPPRRRSRAADLDSSQAVEVKDDRNSSLDSQKLLSEQRRKSSSVESEERIPELPKKRLSIEERMLKLQTEGKCSNRDNAFIAAKLIEMQFEEEDALLASKQCTNVYHAVKFLTQLCEICNCRFPINQMASMVHCTHKACKECLKAHFTTLIHDRSIFALLCPICYKPDISDHNIQDYFNHLDMMLRNILAKDVYDLFQRKLRDEVLTKDPNFHWCSQCSSGFIASPRLKKLYCPDCSAVTCALCHQTWELEHEGVHCERFQQWKDMHTPEPPPAGLVKALTERGVTCPSCGIKYAHAAGGCMVYKCSHCSLEFCAFCMKRYKKGKECQVLPVCENLRLHCHHAYNCLSYLRDKACSDLQQILTENKVPYLTIPPPDQIVKTRCQVREQKHVHGAVSEDRCGRSIEPYMAGLCRVHYKEYLAELLRKNRINPLPSMTMMELQFMMRKVRMFIPERVKGESAEEYRARILKEINTHIPL